MKGPPFYFAISALRWAYMVLESASSSGLNQGVPGTSRSEMNRSDWISQAGRIRGSAEQHLTADELAYARAFVGRCATHEDMDCIRIMVQRALPDYALPWVKAANDPDDIITMFILKAGGQHIGWRRVQKATQCRVSKARDAYRKVGARFIAVRLAIEERLVAPLRMAGIIQDDDRYDDEEQRKAA